MEVFFTFQWGGGGLFFRWGASFLSRGVHPVERDIGFDGGFQKKS